MLAASKLEGTVDGGNSRPFLRTPRDVTLDFVKGVLVVVMVVYHAMNIFSAAGPDEYVYVRFVSASFILLSGYIVARFEQTQFKVGRLAASRRLFRRALKLLMLFTALNLLINLTGIGNPSKLQPGVGHYLGTLFDVYVSGNPKAASFQILLPISYLLAAAPVFFSLARWNSWLLITSWCAVCVLSLVAVSSVNLEFAVLGAVGLSGGIFLNRLGRPLFTLDWWGAAGIVMGTVLLMKYVSANLVTYTLGTILILKSLYDLGLAIGSNRRWMQGLVLLGQYSLFCYIAQIMFMQLLHRGLSQPRWNLGFETALVISGTVVFLLVLCTLVAGLSSRYRPVARMYRMVFA